MNFLIFRDFPGIFLFYEFNLIYFELKWIKIIFLSYADMAVDMVGAEMHCHMAVYVHAHVEHTYACVRMCAHVCACAISEIKHPSSVYNSTH